MAKRDYRPKASELFAREENRVFGGKKLPFAKAFPNIVDFRIEVKRPREGSYGEKETLTYTPDNPPSEYVDCKNNICYGGGFSLGKILRKMVREKETELETSEVCKGYKGSPKGHRKYDICTTLFEVKIDLKCSDESNERLK